VRLFVAFEVPSAIRAEIGARVATLRESLPRARWVSPEAMHLTLVFLGEVNGERLPDLESAGTAAVAGEAPLRLRVGAAGSFPAGRPARVAWLGLDSDRELAPLARRLAEDCGRAASVEVENKPYHPHLTLARCDPPWPRAAVADLGRAFSGGIGEPFAVAEAVLFRSTLGQGPARHEALQHWPLGGAR
jgi:RNA 2',3'-cyclic 3'-phosphodiesterase